MQLYSIPIEIERVLDDPTLTDEERATALEALNYDFDDKVEAIVKFYQKEEADLAHIQGEINRLNRMKKTISTRRNGVSITLRVTCYRPIGGRLVLYYLVQHLL